MSVRITSPSLVGRREELEQLRAAYDRAVDGDPSVVLVGGDAGVGKTRLLAEWSQQLRDVGALSVTGGCLELGEGVLPFAPVEDALRELERVLGDERFRTLLRGQGREILRSLRGLEVGPGGEVTDGVEPVRMFHAVFTLLETLADEQPVALVLEDLHWADGSTLDLLEFLARRLRHGAVLVVGSYRTDELHRRHPLRPVIAGLSRVATVERLHVGPLAPEDVARQLTGILGPGAPGGLVDEVVERSEGNPFYAEELLAWRRSAGVGPLPPTLRDILAARIDRLGPDTRRVLRVAAAAGQEVDPRLVEAVAGAVAEVPSEQTAAGLRAAVEEAIVSPASDGWTFRFRHALLREAVYDELLPGEHGELHRAIAETLEARPELARTGPGGRAAELAHHWYVANEPDRAFTASIEAARAACEVYAYAESQRHTERALELYDRLDPQTRADAPPRWELLREAANHAINRGDVRSATAHLRAAVEQAADESRLVRASLLSQLGYVLWKRGDETASLQLSEQSMAVVPTDEPTPELAEVLSGHSIRLMLLERHDQAVPLARRAIEVAQTVDATGAESDARNTLGASLANLGRHDEGVAQLEEAVQLAKRTDVVHLVLRAHVNLGFVHAIGGQHDRAVEVGYEGLAWAEEHGVGGIHTAFLRLNQVQGLWWTGRWDEADEQVRELGDLGEENVLVAHHAMSIGRLRVWQGRLDEARELVQRGRRAAAGDLGAQFRVGAAVANAELALVEGDPDRAREAFGHLDDLEVGPYFQHEVPVALLAALAALVAEADDDPDGAASLRERAVAHLDRVRAQLECEEPGSPQATLLTAGVRVAQAELTRAAGDSDPSAWADAVEAVTAIGSPPREASVRWRHAQALLTRDEDRETAESELRRAREAAARMGAAPLLHAVDDLARRARIALPGMPPQHGAEALGLTPREHEVLRLVAAGHTNSEIGEALFISGKTASVHVSNILSKLEVDGREEAAALAQQLGVV